MLLFLLSRLTYTPPKLGHQPSAQMGISEGTNLILEQTASIKIRFSCVSHTVYLEGEAGFCWSATGCTSHTRVIKPGFWIAASTEVCTPSGARIRMFAKGELSIWCATNTWMGQLHKALQNKTSVHPPREPWGCSCSEESQTPAATCLSWKLRWEWPLLSLTSMQRLTATGKPSPKQNWRPFWKRSSQTSSR